MSKRIMTIMLALFLVVGGFSVLSASAEADCGKCAASKKAKVCAKCKKAGKKTCGCKSKHSACDKCKKAGKKDCGCHKH
jgi:hypothetical protein